MVQLDTTDQIELFIQGEGIPKITLVKVYPKDTVADIIKVAREHGLSAPEGSEICVFVENTDAPLAGREDRRARPSPTQSHTHPPLPERGGVGQL